MEPESLLPCAQEFTTGPYPVSDESNEQLRTLFLGFIVILSYHLRPGLPSLLQVSHVIPNVKYFK